MATSKSLIYRTKRSPIIALMSKKMQRTTPIMWTGSLILIPEMVLAALKGLPQFGHETASVEISFPQSGHCLRFVIIAPCIQVFVIPFIYMRNGGVLSIGCSRFLLRLACGGDRGPRPTKTMERARVI
jgi:hypothetical protein